MYIIWIIVIAIVIIMAIVGYMAEHTKEGKETTKIKEENIDKVENENSTWTSNAPVKDEKQEIEHKVPSIDDWSKIPETANETNEVKLETPNENPTENKETVMFDSPNANQSEIKEVPVETSNIQEIPAPATTSTENQTENIGSAPAIFTNDLSTSSEPVIENITPEPLPTPPVAINPAVLPAEPIAPTPTMISTENQVSIPTISTGNQDVTINPIAGEITTGVSNTSLENSNSNENINNVQNANPIEPVQIPIQEQITKPSNTENIWS